MSTFNAPPSWPEPPSPDWVPPADWAPPLAWGPTPAGWRLRAEEHPGDNGPRPILPSEEVPASGARPPAQPADYPVTVHIPGQWEHHEVPENTHGFGPAPVRRSRPRLRMAVIILCLVLGILLATAAAIGFVMLARYGQENLPASAASLATAASLAARPLLPLRTRER